MSTKYPPPKIAGGAPGKNDRGEEDTRVAIRMRPLNEKDVRVWRASPKHNLVEEVLAHTGQPLLEQVNGRTLFTFDKTFDENARNVDVYDSVAKDIVESVATGLNGTIFAYGQTSSGKTFTMQGSGSIEEGYANGGGGIVHMAANDIFAHVRNTPDRLFLIGASFIEIYNEEVRDLLGDNAVLAIREDPQQGVFVNAKEEIVTDFESLLQVLFSGEKNRAVAATGMNERSSRSHTIFRITIESRDNSDEDSENKMASSNSSLSSDDGAVRISTLNLVDLAGCESGKQTGSTGDRQKEGTNINLSLHKLSRVIDALGKPKQPHVPFRESKLTRILQPSLSGDARMAVICCVNPSGSYLEETRSALLFASRAKLVTTRAQVNEVLDDKSFIKRLQRELAEARRSIANFAELVENCENLETLQKNATQEISEPPSKCEAKKKAMLKLAEELKVSNEKAASEQMEKERVESLLEACTTERDEFQSRLVSVNKDLEDAKETIKTSAETISEVESDRDSLKANLESQITSLEVAKDEVDIKLVETRDELESLGADKESLSQEFEALRANEVTLTGQLQDVQDSLGAARKEIVSLKVLIVEMESQQEELNATLATVSADKGSMESQVVALQSSKAEADTKLAEAIDRLATLETEKQGLFDDILARQANEEAQKEELRNTQASLETAREEIESLQTKISEVEGNSNELGESLAVAQAEKYNLESQLIDLEGTQSELAARGLDEAVIQVDTLEAEKQEMHSSIDARDSTENEMADSLKEAQEQIQSLQTVIDDLKASEKDAEASTWMMQEVEAEATELKQLLSAANDSFREAREATLTAEDKHEEKKKEVQGLLQRLADSEEKLRVATDNLSALEQAESSKEKDNAVQLVESESRIRELESVISMKNDRIAKLEKWKLSTNLVGTINLLRADYEKYRDMAARLQNELVAAENNISELQSKVASLSRKVSFTASEVGKS